MSNSSKLTNILDQAFDKPWEKYSAEEYKIQLEETKSKVRELTPEQELKLMNKRMNLRIQVTAIYKKDRHGSKATRKRYYQAACYACDYIAGTCNLQKFANFHPKHFREVTAYWKTTKELNTVYTELTGLRQYCEYAGCKYKMPENKELNLPKREPTKYNRAWLPHEIQRVKELAETMGRFDVRDAIELGEKLGLRIIEACQFKVGDVKSALGWGGLEIKGKGGQIRFVPIETEEQKELLQRLYHDAKAKGLMDGDFILSKTIKYGPMREKKSIENWIYNNRKRFTDPNRQQTVKPGKKPRVENIVFHGLRHTYTQERDKRLKNDPRRQQKLSEGLGHHRLSVTNIYKE